MRRRTAALEVAAVLLGSVMIVCGCDSGGGGGGPSGTITVSVDGGADKTYTGPAAFASYFTSANDPFPANSMGVMVGDMDNYGVMVSFTGDTVGSYDVATDQAIVMYAVSSAQPFFATFSVLGDTGTVTVTAVGAEGEMVEGSFDVTASEFAGDPIAPTGNTVTLTGTFSVERVADDYLP